LEKQRLKYGRATRAAPARGSTITTENGQREAWMGKSDRKITTKKAQPKHAHKGGVNGAAADRASFNSKKSAAKPNRKSRSHQSSIILPEGYRPSENEPFMNERHKIYFRNKLVSWKEEIIRQNRETLHILHEDSAQHADLADRATSETDRALELRARDRQRKLIAKIDAAIARIEEGTYGFCEETGEPIGLKRLDARPIATLSLEAQERHERREKVFRED
jgi:DnaK suppressor protein